jgi:hypothetical protein
MTDATATPPGSISAADVENALIALRARLRETAPDAYLTRPLQRRQIAALYRIVLNYQALMRRKDKS